MPIVPRLMLIGLLAALSLHRVHAAEALNPPKPAVPYWHLWIDQAGQSHLTQCRMSTFTLQSMKKPADPQWQDAVAGGANVVFTQQPAGWNGAWHPDPHVQFVVPLTGSWFVEAQDGTRAEMGPGSVFLGEDQNSKPGPDGKTGHLAGNLGEGAVTLMIASLDAAPTVGQPCHVK